VKKILNINIVLLLLVCVFSCSTDDKNEVIYDSNLVQKQLGKEERVNDYMKIERIYKDDFIAKQLLNNISYDDVKNLDLDDIRKINYGWTDCFVFEIPFKKNENKRLSIFNIEKNYITTVVEIFAVNSRLKSVNVSSTNNLPLYRFDIIDDEKLGNFVDINFGNNFGQQNIVNDHKYDKMEDCGKYGFTECMECGFDVCDQDWRCRVGQALTGPAFVAGLAITCGIRQLTDDKKTDIAN